MVDLALIGTPNTVRRGPIMTATLEPVADEVDQQRLAEQLLTRRRGRS